MARPGDVKAVTLTMHAEALRWLKVLAPTRKGHGGYLSQLIMSEVARKAERDLVYRELQDTLQKTA